MELGLLAIKKKGKKIAFGKIAQRKVIDYSSPLLEIASFLPFLFLTKKTNWSSFYKRKKYKSGTKTKKKKIKIH